jgi:molecular chaperone GrpE
MVADEPNADESTRGENASGEAEVAPASGRGEPESADLTDLERDVAELREIAKERDHFLDRLQRVTAELENYRKRVQREREQWRRYALEGFLRDLLPTVDNLERAIRAARESQDLEGLLTGLELIDHVLQDTLGRYGVKPVQAVGRPFDPFDHEAVEMVAGEGEPPGTVLAELQRGYRFYEHLLRPARVRVVRPRQPEASGEEGEGKAPSAGGKALDIS